MRQMQRLLASVGYAPSRGYVHNARKKTAHSRWGHQPLTVLYSNPLSQLWHAPRRAQVVSQLFRGPTPRSPPMALAMPHSTAPPATAGPSAVPAWPVLPRARRRSLPRRQSTMRRCGRVGIFPTALRAPGGGGANGRGSSLRDSPLDRNTEHARFIIIAATRSRRSGLGGRSIRRTSALSRTPSGQGGGRVVRIEGIEGRVSDARRSDIRSRDLVKSRAFSRCRPRGHKANVVRSGPPARRPARTPVARSWRSAVA